MYLMISLGLAATSVVTVIGCAEVHDPDSEEVLTNCISSWVIRFLYFLLDLSHIRILNICFFTACDAVLGISTAFKLFI